MRLSSNPIAFSAALVTACGAASTEAPAAKVPATPSPPAAVVQAPPPLPKGHPREDLIPRSVLFGNPDRTSVEISPDGKYLSWLAPLDGVMNVWVTPANKLDQAKPITADHTRPVRVYSWTFDGTHLLYSQDTGGDENAHIFRVSADGTDIKDLTPYPGAKATLIRQSERKPNVVLLGVNDRDPKAFDIYQFDLRSGERTLVLQDDQQLLSYVFDHDLNLKLADHFLPDGAVEWLRYDAKNKRFTPYEKIPAEDAMTSTLLQLDKSGKTLYATDSRGRNTGALLGIDVETKRARVLHEDPRTDLVEAMFHPTEHGLEAVLVNYDKPRWQVLDKRIQPDIDMLSKLDQGGAAPEITSRSLDDRTWIVLFKSDTAGWTYYRWHRQSRKSEFLFNTQPALAAQPLAKMHPVVIPARDQLPLVSYLTLPKESDPEGSGRPKAPLPMVLLVHGGPWSRDDWGFRPNHQMLANRGYAVLSVNFRGSTGFGKDHVNRGNFEWGKKMHQDLLDAVEWAVGSQIAQRDKIAIMGGSYGGYATLAGVTLTPDTFACGVDIVGPSNIVTLLETVPPYWAPIKALFQARVGDHTTDAGKRALLEVSPLTHAGDIKRPLLIAQGANDPRVKQSESDQIVKAMQAKHIPVGYVLFPDEGHGFARPENNVAFMAVAEAFLSVHLGGAYQPLTAAELSASTLQVVAGSETLPGLPAEREAAAPAHAAR